MVTQCIGLLIVCHLVQLYSSDNMSLLKVQSVDILLYIKIKLICGSGNVVTHKAPTIYWFFLDTVVEKQLQCNNQ